MAKRRQSQEEEGGSWMDTYGDMITLVLTFFVLLYSMSSMDQSKWQYLASALSKSPAIEEKAQVVLEPNAENDPTAIYDNEVPEVDDAAEIVDFEDFYMYLKEVVVTNNLQESVSVEMSNTGVYMRFRDNIFFGGDSDVLLDEGKYILDIISDGIRSVNERIYAIKVSGHTAGASNSDVNEWSLSSGRANSVINYMLGRDVCEPDKFSSAGYGKYRPVDENDTEEGRRQNRRVEIIFVRNDVDFTDPEVVNELLQLEYGKGFVQPSDENGEISGGGEAAEEAVPDIDSQRTDPDRVYYSKEDMLAENRS
ncbi:MAG: flagellar motor protein MotB [Oscillospiraceae bacterium]|nr:flagellar motor protein MotB [Oscillospiraceae bacterium]MDE6132867.1 flagellar motor protein MotB [Oscillospiraceae bacterium]